MPAEEDEEVGDETLDDEPPVSGARSAVGEDTAPLAVADLVPVRPSDEVVTGPRPRSPAPASEASTSYGRAPRETEIVLGLQARSSPAQWTPDPAPAASGDPVYVLRSCLARMRAAPADLEVRRQLRAAAGDREAREVLAALLGDEASAADRADIAAAFLEELADVLEDLERPLDAIAAMERLVRVVPNELLHHDRLARLYHRERAWLKAAAAFEEVAALATDARARAALRAAAALYRTHGRPERAIELYRVIGERFPADVEARAALDELLAAELPRPAIAAWPELPKPSGRALRAAPAERAAALRTEARALQEAGNLAGAARVLEQACESDPDDDELARERDRARAAVLIQRAAAEAKAGDLASAERRLRAVLAAQPHEPDAHLALVRLLEDRGDRERAVAHLAGALEELPDLFAPDARARLLHRHALFVAERGAGDEAHVMLHDAHRLDRRNVVITLALAESCFARRLWRESAILFNSLAERADAGAHAAAIAAGLVRAAVADARALRPANAERYLTAAVKLDPACAAAWRALGERAKERGDVRGALEHFEREAAATSDPAARARLFEAAGDLARDALDDPPAAERCWLKIDDAGAPLLEKLLAVQRGLGAALPRARTCDRLAGLPELASEDGARRDLLVEAAEAYAASGEPEAIERTAAIAKQLAAAHPLDVDAIACASAIAIAAGDTESAATWLGRALPAWDKRADSDRTQPDPRRAELWRRYGDALRAQDDALAAQGAYDRAVAAAPDSTGALAARRGLVAVSEITGRSAVDALAALAAAEQDPGDILAWARACGSPDDARALFELARALGAELSADDQRALARRPARSLAADQAYAAALDDAERRALVDDADDAPLAALLAMLGEVAALVCPTAQNALFESEFAEADKLSVKTYRAAAAAYPAISKALGGPVALLYTTAGRDAPPASILLASPPVVVLGPQLGTQRPSRTDLRAASDVELRFHLGRATELARVHRCFAAGVPPERFARLVEGLRWAVQHDLDGAAAEVPPTGEARRLRHAIPLLLRRRIAEQLAAIPDGAIDPSAYAAACQRAADRSGLLACGDAATAIRLAGGAGAARHVVKLAASPRYLAARRALWTPRRP